MTGQGSSNSQSGTRRERITVRVLFFGAAREIAGRDEISLDLIAPATAATAFDEILSHYPDLRRFGRSLLFALNQEYAERDATVRAGDELALFPPVSGGAEEGDAAKEKNGEQESEQ